jgi:hypothetical protein
MSAFAPAERPLDIGGGGIVVEFPGVPPLPVIIKPDVPPVVEELPGVPLVLAALVPLLMDVG